MSGSVTPKTPQHLNKSAKKASWSRWVFRLAAISLGVIAPLLLVEVFLRLTPNLFGPNVQDLAFSRYNISPGGMFVLEKRTRVRFMRTNADVRTYSHGYWWNHTTDAFGFRNPPDLERRDVLLLGDSFIYGHGVEEDETVGHLLRADHGIPAYNMGRQGNCLYENYVVYRLYADEIKPETVVVFVFLNDILDLVNRRRPDEIAEPPEIGRFRYASIRKRVRRLQKEKQPWATRFAFKSALFRLAYMYETIRSEGGDVSTEKGHQSRTEPENDTDLTHTVRSTRKAKPSLTPATKPQNATVSKPGKKGRKKRKPNRFAEPVLDDTRFQPVMRYYDLVLGDLNTRCKAAGTRLVVVQLFLAKSNRGEEHLQAQKKIRHTLEEIAQDRHFEFYDTYDLYTNCDGCFLPGDGHLTAEGHQRLAQFLAERLEQEKPHLLSK